MITPILKIQTGRKKNKDESKPVENNNQQISDKVNFSAKINEITKKNNHLGAIASLFVGDKNILPNIKNEVVKNIKSATGEELGIDAGGMVRVGVADNIISPYMFLKTSQKDNAEISLHELIHYYVDPYLYAYSELKKGTIKITDPVQEKISTDLFKIIDTLYTDATSKGYIVKNGVSTEDSIYEFVATISNKASAAKLKELGIYDGLLTTLKKHIDTITTVDIPYTMSQAA